jgi:hypothetical protein
LVVSNRIRSLRRPTVSVSTAPQSGDKQLLDLSLQRRKRKS